MSICKYALFPSHVSVKSFVTVKLNDRHMYLLWKTQMLCLLKIHDMLGFINESSPVGDEWNRNDTLAHAWILGSLSEHAAIAVLNSIKSKKIPSTAKNVWDQVQSLYGQEDNAEQKGKMEGGSCGINGGSCDNVDVTEKVKEKRKQSRNKQLLYHALECGQLEEALGILEKENIEIVEPISINDNTTLHIAVAYSSSGSDRFLKRLLNMIPNDMTLKNVRNVDGSTPLHLAASYGNTIAAEILLGKSRDLLYAKDNEGCTPLDIVLSEPRSKEMCLLLMKRQDHQTFATHEHLLNAISYKHFDLALEFIKRCDSFKSRDVLLAIAQNCPVNFTPNQLLAYELFQTPVLEFITRGASDMKGCTKFAYLVLRAVLAYSYKLVILICMKLQVFRDLKKRMKQRKDVRVLLDVVCASIRLSREREDEAKAEAGDFYTKALLEAIRRDASDVVEIIVYWFSDATLMVDKDGHNIAQIAWKNRASKVYALMLDGSMAKHTSLSSQNMKQDHFGNNFLHYAARLAHAKNLDRTSVAPFRMQRELLWFKLAHKITPQGWLEKNCFGETPKKVFTKEHKDLEIESGEWIETTANAVAITSTLIITIMFLATIQVPGGSDNHGFPRMISQPAFMIFEVAITCSALSAALSLLLFLVILTSPRTQEAYVFRLPLALVIGIFSLFMSATLAILAFASALYLIFGYNNQWFIGLIAPLVALPIFLFFFVYSWFVSVFVSDFMNSAGHFFIIHTFRRFQLMGRIYI